MSKFFDWQKFQKQLAFISTLIFCLLLIWYGIRLILVQFSQDTSVSSIQQSAIQPEKTQVKASAPSQKYPQLTVFGKTSDNVMLPSDSAEHSNASHDELEEADLDIQLIGVISHPTMRIAMIKHNGSVENFSVGDNVLDGVTLIDIQTTFVVVDDQGKRKKLSLPFETNLDWISASKLSDQAGTVLSGSELKSGLKHIGEALKQGPMALNRFLKFKPVYTEGKLSGVKIWPKRQAKLFQEVGLRAGDKVLSVNGRSVQSIFQSPSEWGRLLKLSTFTFEIDRDNHQKTVTLNLS
ncbi:MAG: type II secretion system protein N [Hydrogenovibrio sp.]|uniref:type II secretion system protein N n=1 Tax=Hydrogenovibrio sp. TaxID=2065821 RepID=UPI0028708433|nr:type II secretion system protein N [Hydrogenovibrio sp.]MDR9499553.1 type II secretion system protein N [Hydrogenovibrio sp.]